MMGGGRKRVKVCLVYHEFGKNNSYGFDAVPATDGCTKNVLAHQVPKIILVIIVQIKNIHISST